MTSRSIKWLGVVAVTLLTVLHGSFADANDFVDQLRSYPQVYTNPPFATDSLLVKYREDVSPNSADGRLFSTYGVRDIAPLGGAEYPWNRVATDLRAHSKADRVDALLDLYERLLRDPTFAAVDLNWSNFELFYAPDDPYAIDDGAPDDGNPDQFYLWPMNVLEAWDTTRGSSDVLVAVVDSGVAVSHPDLADVIAPGGYDFADGDDNPATDIPGDPGNGDGEDNNGDGYADVGVPHGTHVAGLIGGIMDNGTGIAGPAGGGTRILPVRVMTDEGAGDLDAISNGIKHAADQGADVINLSLGMPPMLYCAIPVSPPQAMVDAVNYAYDKGAAVIAATGNGAEDGQSCGVSYPAAFENSLAVGSSNAHQQRSAFSDFGGEHEPVDVTALGGDLTRNGDDVTITEAIWSTYVVSQAAADEDPDLQPADHVYAGALGTSMATPEAAALAALVKSLSPEASPAAVYDLLRNNAIDIEASGWDEETGYGQVDYLATVQAAATSTVAAD